MSKYKYNVRERNKRRKFFTGITVLVLLIASIIGVQLFLNRKSGDVGQAKTLDVQATNEESGNDNKSSEKEKNNETKKENKALVANGLNMSEEGLKYADSGDIAQKVINNTYEKDGKKVAYLTFDDGPSTTVTPKILDVLKKEEVHGTFFLMGKNIKDDTKDILIRTLKDGHAIGNHSYSHDYKVLYPNRSINSAKVMEEYEAVNNKIREIVGQEFDTKVFRFPGGFMSWKNGQDIKNKFSEKGIHYIDWNALNGDAEGKKRTSKELVQRAKDTVGNHEKVVILMHDTYGKETTAEALPDIIKFLREQGYEFRTIK